MTLPIVSDCMVLRTLRGAEEEWAKVVMTRELKCAPILLDVLRPVRVCVPASGWEEKNILALEVASTLRPRLDHRPVAVCEERVVERDARVKLLADEEVAVV